MDEVIFRKGGEMKDNTWWEDDRTDSWEEVYQAFTARRESEVKEGLKAAFPNVPCRCPFVLLNGKDECQFVKYVEADEVCTHPSNKPPEPECEHAFFDYHHIWRKYKDEEDKYCRDCGEKL